MSDHAHHSPREHEAPRGYYQTMEVAVCELLVEKGVLTEDDIGEAIALMDARSPAIGAAVVARAWVDADFKARLLADGSAACAEMGIDIGPTLLVVVENTADVHNVFVCTLCSCYPRNLMGLPPAWYKARPYRSRVVREPRAVLAGFGTTLPDDVTIRVHDSTADMRYLVLPRRPPGTEGLDEAALAALVTRDSMIGVGLPNTP